MQDHHKKENNTNERQAKQKVKKNLSNFLNQCIENLESVEMPEDFAMFNKQLSVKYQVWKDHSYTTRHKAPANSGYSGQSYTNTHTDTRKGHATLGFTDSFTNKKIVDAYAQIFENLKTAHNILLFQSLDRSKEQDLEVMQQTINIATATGLEINELENYDKPTDAKEVILSSINNLLESDRKIEEHIQYYAVAAKILKDLNLTQKEIAAFAPNLAKVTSCIKDAFARTVDDHYNDELVFNSKGFGKSPVGKNLKQIRALKTAEIGKFAENINKLKKDYDAIVQNPLVDESAQTKALVSAQQQTNIHLEEFKQSLKL